MCAMKSMVLATALALLATPLAAANVSTVPKADVKVLTTDVMGPEGPTELPDGSVAMVEFLTGNILRVTKEGTRSVLASFGSGVAGTALGKDGRVYVARVNLSLFGLGAGKPVPGAAGEIELIDLNNNSSRPLYTAVDGMPLKGPDDLVTDPRGDVWVTDAVDNSVYWAKADGSAIKRIISDVPGVNGITFSPDQRTLYIYSNGQILGYAVAPGGKVGARRVIARLPKDRQPPDGMKTEANGNILLACGQDGIIVLSPSGKELAQVKLPDLRTINMGFGGPRKRTMYIAANPLDSMTGMLVAIPWPRRGL